MNFHSIRCIMRLVVCFISPCQMLGDIKHMLLLVPHLNDMSQLSNGPHPGAKEVCDLLWWHLGAENRIM